MPLPIFKSQESKSPPHPFANIRFVIAIAAGKGGVGKSTVAVNLALALQAQGYRVGIMDTDIYGPSIRKMLPEDRMPSQKGTEIQPALCKGIKMISIAYFRKENEAAAVRAPIANGLIAQFINHVAWGELDFLLIDFPPGTGDVQLTLSQKAQLTGALIVTTPQEVALLDVRKAMSLFEQVKVPILGIVENMSYYQESEGEDPVYLFGQGGGEKLSSETGNPLLGQIPLDPVLCTCADRGDSIFSQDSDSLRPITRSFQHIATRLAQQAGLTNREMTEGLGSFELIWKEMGP